MAEIFLGVNVCVYTNNVHTHMYKEILVKKTSQEAKEAVVRNDYRSLYRTEEELTGSGVPIKEQSTR